MAEDTRLRHSWLAQLERFDNSSLFSEFKHLTTVSFVDTPFFRKYVYTEDPKGTSFQYYTKDTTGTQNYINDHQIGSIIESMLKNICIFSSSFKTISNPELSTEKLK